MQKINSNALQTPSETYFFESYQALMKGIYLCNIGKPLIFFRGWFFIILQVPTHAFLLAKVGKMRFNGGEKFRLPKDTSETPLLYIPNFSDIAQFGEELCEERAKKMRKTRKPDQQTTSFGRCGGEMRLKSRDLLKAHLGPLLNVHTKFQLPSSICKGDRGIALFHDQKRGEISISPLLIDAGGWFFDMLYNFWLSIDWP